MIYGWLKKELEEYGRKRSWVNLWYYSGTGLEGRREITQKSVKIIRLGAEIWIQDLPDSKWHCQLLYQKWEGSLWLVSTWMDDHLGALLVHSVSLQKERLKTFLCATPFLAQTGHQPNPSPPYGSVGHTHQHSITVFTSTLKMEVACNSEMSATLHVHAGWRDTEAE
jgi:hypothetical protein